MNKTLKKVLKTILIILLVLVAAVILFIGYLTITEYKPKDTESLDIDGSSSETLAAGDDFTIMTWNMAMPDLAKTLISLWMAVNTSAPAPSHRSMTISMLLWHKSRRRMPCCLFTGGRSWFQEVLQHWWIRKDHFFSGWLQFYLCQKLQGSLRSLSASYHWQGRLWYLHFICF